jgi:hypothetical protein
MTIDPDDSVPACVALRIRRAAPAGSYVLAGSTPVVAFGDPRRAAVATLGLNPSISEFEERGIELDGALRRFETLRSLDVPNLDNASDEAITRVWRRCNANFHGNPYRWFNPLEAILGAVDASYYADTACHLDLSQWATNPSWSSLPRSARERLVAEDAEFLRLQLRSEPIRLLLLNGRAVLRAFQHVLGGRLDREQETVTDRSVAAELYSGRIGQVIAIGWSTNLQSSFGVTSEFQLKLAASVRRISSSISYL